MAFQKKQYKISVTDFYLSLKPRMNYLIQKLPGKIGYKIFISPLLVMYMKN